MCNRTDCAGVWAGPMACARCVGPMPEINKNGGLKMKNADLVPGGSGAHNTTSGAICNNSMADEITLHYTSDGWDTPFRVCLCRDHQRELIGPVQEAVRKMREEREVKRAQVQD